MLCIALPDATHALICDSPSNTNQHSMTFVTSIAELPTASCAGSCRLGAVQVVRGLGKGSAMPHTAASRALAHTLWNMSQMAERGWWMAATMVCPRAARLLRCSMMLRAAKESSPVVGSSRNNSDGRAMSAHAMLSLRFSPPASPGLLCK